MKHQLRCFYCITAFFFCYVSFGQDVSLLEQFNGRFDFTFVGNTLNTNAGNNYTTDCTINTTSNANLNLATGNEIEKAYLYWAGSGTGDFDVKLNGTPITASRTFALAALETNYFSAYADVTELVKAVGNGTYIFSDLDLNAVINTSVYCINRTNFGGWAIVIIYKNDLLPLNQLNLYDGLQGIPDEINITLNSLNVIDNIGAKIGFVAWEGDRDLSNETLKINGVTLSNALNPPNNPFNGTNTITGSNELYNMDLDIYDIQNTIQIGDSTALIQLTSAADFVMVSTILTKLNSQLPDAVIAIDAVEQQCDSRRIVVDYTVSNPNSTNPLPAGIPISIYANDTFLQYTETLGGIPIDGTQSDSISLDIPAGIPNDFILKFIVDMGPEGTGNVTEIHEDNNTYTLDVSLWASPQFNALPMLEGCNQGSGKGTFNFSSYVDLVKVDPLNTVSFFNSLENASSNTNPIAIISDYTNVTTPEEIFVRIQDSHGCFSITSFLLKVKNCPPAIFNLVAPKPDNYYDTFLIDGLRDIFTKFKLSIYNRWGALVWEGDNTTPDWDGTASKGVRVMGNELPEGTYYYILELNDADYPNPMTGFVYLKRE